jgi:RNA polymerase sigma factor (sigma-70 family)
MNDLEPVDVDELFERYAFVIRNMARRIVSNNNSVVSLEDLEQAGCVALVSAIDSYDASAGSLGSYIRTCVRNALVAEANKYCGVFTIDPRIRLQVNQIIRLRENGHSNEEIKSLLGINNQDRFRALLSLVDIRTIECERQDIIGADDDTCFYDAKSVIKALREIGLNEDEVTLVELTITNHTRQQIMQILNVNGMQYSRLRQSIRDKIVAWGETE